MAGFIEVQNEIASKMAVLLEDIFEDDLKDDPAVKAGLYSLEAGGKRLRPAIMYSSARMLGVEEEEIRPFAVALEIIHTYSLIHDDLPALDNDDLRRGKPTCHKAFGESIAILAGDMLLNRAFEILMRDVLISPSHSYAALKMAGFSGIRGMVGGQSMDMSSQGKKLDKDELKLLQYKKTGALIKAAFMTPYYIMHGDGYDNVGELLSSFSDHVGSAFQIKDDILDVESDKETLGKSVGKDEAEDKSTFVTACGLEGAKEELRVELSSAREDLKTLKELGFDTEIFESLADYLEKREN